jgi:hypothetical protein
LLGGFVMVLRSRFMMLSSLGVVFCNLGCSHGHCSFPSHFVQLLDMRYLKNRHVTAS